MKCKCGNGRFWAYQVCYHDVFVDEHGVFEEDDGVYDSEAPYGPFICTACGADYDELTEDDE